MCAARPCVCVLLHPSALGPSRMHPSLVPGSPRDCAAVSHHGVWNTKRPSKKSKAKRECRGLRKKKKAKLNYHTQTQPHCPCSRGPQTPAGLRSDWKSTGDHHFRSLCDNRIALGFATLSKIFRSGFDRSIAELPLLPTTHAKGREPQDPKSCQRSTHGRRSYALCAGRTRPGATRGVKMPSSPRVPRRRHARVKRRSSVRARPEGTQDLPLLADQQHTLPRPFPPVTASATRVITNVCDNSFTCPPFSASPSPRWAQDYRIGKLNDEDTAVLEHTPASSPRC